MRKLIISLSLTLLVILSGCGTKELLNSEMKTELRELLNATYLETTYYLNLKTSEYDLKEEEFLNVKNLVTEDGSITSLKTINTSIEDFNLGDIEVVMDETENMLYVANDSEWIKLNLDELMELSESETTSTEELTDKLIQVIDNILLEFNSVVYVGKLEDEKLHHYQLNLNLLKSIKEIYTIINEESDQSLPDFDSFLSEYELTDLFKIFETLVVDVYLNEKQNYIRKMEFDVTQIFDLLIKNEDQLTNIIPVEIDLEEIFSKFERLVVGVKFENLNVKDSLEINSEAINGELISLEELLGGFVPGTDDSAPVISLNSQSEINLYTGEEYIEYGATAFDEQDGNLTQSIVISGSVNPYKEGEYYVYYTVEDSDHNISTVTRIVRFKPGENSYDHVPPTIKLVGEEQITLYVGDTYIEYGATALDNIDGNISHFIQISGNVNTNVSGSYVLYYTVTDSSGIGVVVARYVEVTESPMYTHNISSIKHPTLPIIYYIDGAKKMLVQYNLETKETVSKTFNLQPEQLTFADDKIYVTLLKVAHSSYLDDYEQIGAYAVVNANDFDDTVIYDINLDPFDIAVDQDGYVYITSGSGQWTFMNIYDTEGKLVNNAFIRQQSYVEYNSTLDKVYLIDTDTSPRDISSIQYDKVNEKIYGYDSTYHGYYSLEKLIAISPDGKYLFNNSGNVFSLSSNQGNDILFRTTLNYGNYEDIVFNIQENEFYTLKGNDINVYNYDTLSFKSLKTLDIKGSELFYHNGLFYVLGYDTNNEILVKEIE
ncbi:MAG: hypothetical protein K0Q49_1621 [Haloplasmataceae bacterium]|nr:hypothetical protein [Haloplasmataceae bacterium]